MTVAMAPASAGATAVHVPGGSPAEADILTIGRAIAEAMPSPLRRPRWAVEGRLMDALARDPAVRAAIFRLVDVAPACRSLDDLAHHFVALTERIERPPYPIRVARRLGGGGASRTVVGALAKAGVRTMARRFIIGVDAGGAAREIDALWRRGIATSIDLLGEATVTRSEADAYAQRCRDALIALHREAGGRPTRPHLERDGAGAIPRVNLSIKVSALTADARAADPTRGVAGAAARLRELLRCARALDAHLHVDMESVDLLQTVDELVFTILEEPEFGSGPSVGVVLQGYLLDAPERLERWIGWAQAHERGMPLTVRLVKGAYWDHEVVQAAQLGWPAPVVDGRSECDRAYEALTRRLLAARPAVRVAIASHNLRSIAHALAAARIDGNGDDIEVQVLRGLGDDVQDGLARLGVRVRTYCPVGEIVAGMAYLVRRLLENTSNDSFLSARAQGRSLDELLAAP